MTARANHEDFPRRTSADTSGDNQRILQKLEAASGDLDVLRLTANSSALLGPFVRFTAALLGKTSVPRATIESAILYVAGRAGQTYEIREHEAMGRASGLTEQQIKGLVGGEVAPELFDPDQRLVVELAAAVRNGSPVPPELWGRCVAVWELEGVLELLLIISFYAGTMPLFLNSLGMS